MHHGHKKTSLPRGPVPSPWLMILQGGAGFSKPSHDPRTWPETALPLPKTGHARQVGSREWSGRLPAASTAPSTPAAGYRGRRRAPEAVLGWSQCHAARAAARRRRAAPQGVAGTFVYAGSSLSAQPPPVFDQKHCRSRPPSISGGCVTAPLGILLQHENPSQ